MNYFHEKPYYSLSDYLKETFGEKLYKLSLNAGLSCPNRDGTLDTRGCIFCSAGGSGEFAASSLLSITEQIEQAKTRIEKKYSKGHYIAYFQAYTNTYAPVSYLEKIFTEAIAHPDIKAVSIATRPDCLSLEILELLDKLNKQKPIWIELGLQTIHPATAAFIRRSYDLSVFETAVSHLHALQIPIIVHVILGLPKESPQDMLQTIDYLSHLGIQGIKLQLLHILKNTDLAQYYKKNLFSILTLEEYIDIVISCLEHLSPEIVIHRLTGDGPRNLLIAPAWSLQKRNVLNMLHQEMKARKTYQGRMIPCLRNH